MILISKIRATAQFFPRTLSTISSDKINQPVNQTYFYKDTRIGERRSYGKPLKLKDGRTIRFEIADEKDEDLLLNQYLDGFVNKISYMRAFNATREDYYDSFKKSVKALLPDGGTMFGFHEDNLVSFSIMTYHKRENIPKVFGPLASPSDPPPVLEFPKDLGPLVDAQPYDVFIPRFTYTMLEIIEKQMGKFFPSDIKQLAYVEAIFVHDEFQRNGISDIMSDVADALAIDHGCDYVANIAVATSSAKLFKKRGFKTMFSIPNDQIYVHGELKFKQLWDKNEGWSANLRKLIN